MKIVLLVLAALLSTSLTNLSFAKQKPVKKEIQQPDLKPKPKLFNSIKK